MPKIKRQVIIYVAFLLTILVGVNASANSINRVQPEFSVVANPETYGYYASTPDGVIAIQIWDETNSPGKKYYYTLDGSDPIPGTSNEITTDERIFITKPGKSILKIVEANSEGQESYIKTREFNLLPGATFVPETANMNITDICVSGKNIAFVAKKEENQKAYELYIFETETKYLRKIAEYKSEWISMKYVGTNLVYSVYMPNKNKTIYWYDVTTQKISELVNSADSKGLVNLSENELVFRDNTGVFSISLKDKKTKLLLKGNYRGVMIWNQYLAWSESTKDAKTNIYVKNQKTGKTFTVPLQLNDYQNLMWDFRDGILVYTAEGHGAKAENTRAAYYCDVENQKIKMFKQNDISNPNLFGQKIYFSDTGLGIGAAYDINSEKVEVITPRVEEGPYASEDLIVWTRDTSIMTPAQTFASSGGIYQGLFYKDRLNSPPLPDLIAPMITVSPMKLQSHKYTEPQRISINANEEAKIIYRLDLGQWVEYERPFHIDRTTVLEFYAVDTAGNKSPVGYSEYNFSSNYKPPIFVTINDEKLELDTHPIIENGRVLIPVRAISEYLGASVIWEEKAKTITVTKPGTELRLQVENKVAYNNGQLLNLDVAPMIVQGRTFVPVRFISEAFGCDVQWDKVSRNVSISSEKS